MSLENYAKLRKIKTSAGCTVIAHFLLILISLFCIFIPRALLTVENLPVRCKPLSFLGQVFSYIGVFLILLTVVDLLRIMLRAWHHAHSST